MADMFALTCTKCKMTFQRALILAMAQDLGAKITPGADVCSDRGKHDWQETPEEPRLASEEAPRG